MWSATRKPANSTSCASSEIARFKRPKDYVFVDALPKNNYGKILKTDLRELDLKTAGEVQCLIASRTRSR